MEQGIDCFEQRMLTLAAMILAICAFLPDSRFVEAFMTAIGSFIPPGCCISRLGQDAISYERQGTAPPANVGARTERILQDPFENGNENEQMDAKTLFLILTIQVAALAVLYQRFGNIFFGSSCGFEPHSEVLICSGRVVTPDGVSNATCTWVVPPDTSHSRYSPSDAMCICSAYQRWQDRERDTKKEDRCPAFIGASETDRLWQRCHLAGAHRCPCAFQRAWNG